MAAPSSCAPCNCIGPSMDPDFYHQAVIVVLCEILAASGGGGGGGNVNLIEVGGAAIALGQTTMAASIPVVLASNQSNLPTNIAQYGGVATTLGTKVSASSIPVVLASDQAGLSVNPTTPASWALYAEDTAHVSGDRGIFDLGVANTNATTLAAEGDYVPKAHGINGAYFVDIKRSLQVSDAGSLLKAEDAAAASGDSCVAVAGVIRVTPSSQAADGDYTIPTTNDLSAWYTDGVRRSTVTATQPSVLTATSTTILASNAARRYFIVQNNTAANIMISLTGATLTGIVPSATNIGLVLTAGSSYESAPNYCATSNITAYQTSGGTVNTISVIEGA